MSKFVVKNASFYINKALAPFSVTAVTKGTTTSITAANTLAVGDYVEINGTGWKSLDGKYAEVTIASGTAFTVAIDTSGESTTANVATTEVSTIDKDTWIESCLSGLDISGGASDSVSTGTFCNSADALAGAPAASTAALSGFVDPTDPGFVELQTAGFDGLPRYFKFVMPQAADPNGTVPPVMIFEGTVGVMDQSFQTGAAATYTVPVTLSSPPTILLG